MIPKVIHYCWFGGGELTTKAKECIASWIKFCPEYKIIRWNEDNFNVNINPYTRFCYESKRWAFLSDYVRLYVLAEYGGIYFDTDVEVIQDFEHLLRYDAFYSFEDNKHINTGQGFGTVANHELVLSMKEEYDKLCPDETGVFPFVKCPQMNTQALLRYGLNLDGKTQIINRSIILSADYMNPYDDPTGTLKTTPNTISIHWYSKSWMDKKTVLRSRLLRPIHRILGVNFLKRRKKH